MPVARYSTTIDASFDDVDALLEDKVTKPRKYVTAIQHSKILRRDGEHVFREYFQPSPVPLTVQEKIYAVDVPGGRDHVFEHVDNEVYTGAFHNVLTRVQGRDDQVQLEYIMDWQPHPGTQDPITQDTAESMVRRGVEVIQRLAEHPVTVPSWVRDFFLAADSMDPKALEPLLHEDCRFRVGNNVETIGKANVVESSRHVTEIFSAMQHDYVNVDDLGDRAYAECLVEYTKITGDVYLIPFLTLLERMDGKISAVLAYGDMSPLKYGW